MHPAALLLLLSSLLHALRSAAAFAPSSSSNNGTTTTTAGSCAPARCGDLNITYPFSLGGAQPLECGFPAFNLTCDVDVDGGGRAYLTRTFRDRLYRVREIFYGNRSLVVAVETPGFFPPGDGDDVETTCRVPDFFNATSGLALFPLAVVRDGGINRDLTFVYDCEVPPSLRLPLPSTCANNRTVVGAYFSDDAEAARNASLAGCSSATVPVRRALLPLVVVDKRQREQVVIRRDYVRMIRDGFLMEWPPLEDCDACVRRGGECRFVDLSFRCLCRVDGRLRSCDAASSRGKKALAIKIGAGIGAALVCLVILGAASLATLHRRRWKRKRSSSLVGRLIRGASTPLASLKKEFSMSTGSPRTHIFSYEELDEATDGFSDARELGVGGFGTVYKGTLRDGSAVAVKRLYKNSYKGVEQFLNEVDILSRLRHPNLVALYGCTAAQGGGASSSRDLLLVYEFVPNGTLADHLHGNNKGKHGASSSSLPWRTRLGVAVETAGALDYLHSADPQVVHRDVKTNNILLDEAFHVKVADFGLSRLFPADGAATHVSTAPQGTPGYVDPTYHRRYQLTDKSDVYSFGVVLVELISSKPAVDMNRAGADGGDDVNLASMAVRMIQRCEIDQLVDPLLGYGTDAETKRTVDLVAEAAFRCLQPEQDVRPPIREVLDVLRQAQRWMEQQDSCVVSVDDVVGPLKKNSDGSPDSVMYQWISPSTTANNSS